MPVNRLDLPPQQEQGNRNGDHARWREKTNGELTRLETVLSAIRAGKPAPPDLRGIRLIGESLEGADLSGVDLSGAELSSANLSGANLLGAKLVGASLYETDLTNAELLGANLTDANLERCNGQRAGFGGANCTRTRFFESDLAGATFTDAKLEQADLRLAMLDGARLRGANLQGANFEQASLQAADIEYALVEGANFDRADLRKVRLRGLKGCEQASWLGADIFEVDFTGAYLIRRHIMDENYLFEFRNRDRKSAVLYVLWSATSDCGRSVGRWALWTALFAVGFAVLYSQMDIGWGEDPTPIAPLYFSVVTLTSLGYGDITPHTSIGQITVIVEVVVGYVLLGGLISILSTKMARRAD